MFLFDYDPITTEIILKKTQGVPPTATFSAIILNNDLILNIGTVNFTETVEIQPDTTLTISDGSTLGIV